MTKRTKDHYFEDAKKILKYIQEFMKEHVALGVFKVNDTNGPLESFNECPQQKSSGVDCGVYVCYFMRQVANHAKVMPKLLELYIRDFRSKLVTAFLHDKGQMWDKEIYEAEA